MTSFFSYIQARLREPSTIAGLALVASGVTTALQAGGTKEAFVAAGLQVMGGAIAALKADPATLVAVVGPTVPQTVVKVSDQVAAMAAEVSAISTAVAGFAAPKVS